MVQRRVRGFAALIGIVLAMAAATGCEWSLARYSPNGSGHNTAEQSLGVANVADLELALAATVPANPNAVPGGTPVASGDTLYVTVRGSYPGRLAAYSITGSGCGADPLACAPLWTAGPGHFGQAAVAGGRVLVRVDGDLRAYDAAGIEGCSGTPTVCTPVWTAPGWGPGVGGFLNGGPVVADGVAFVSRLNEVGVFDPAGITGCSGTPKVCTPIRTYVLGPNPSFVDEIPSVPSVVDGTLYVGYGGAGFDQAGGALQAFDATGVAGCSGTPKVCTPRWTGAVPGDATHPPAVVDGVAYVGYAYWQEVLVGEDPVTSGNGGVVAFDVAACAALGTSAPCSPDWNGRITDSVVGDGSVGVAVADGLVHVTGAASGVKTFPADGGAACGGAVLCAPIRTSSPAASFYAPTPDPAVANGVLYVNGRAFDASGGAGCSGTPVVCSPLWSTSGGTETIVTNGRVVTLSRTTLSIYRLG